MKNEKEKRHYYWYIADFTTEYLFTLQFEAIETKKHAL